MVLESLSPRFVGVVSEKIGRLEKGKGVTKCDGARNYRGEASYSFGTT